MSLQAFSSVLKKATHDISKRSLVRWRKQLLQHPKHFQTLVTHGRSPGLSLEDQALMTGWVLSKNAVNEAVAYNDVMDWPDQEIGVTLSLPTTISYCRANHLSKLEAKVRSAAQAALTNHQQLQVSLECIE